jgi:hypothetical protein
MRVAPEIELTDEERVELSKLARSQLSSVRLVQRARIVLLAADGMQNKGIAQQLGVGRVQVSRWREHGLKPHLVRGFKLSRDPEFAEKLGDVVGLYLNPPANAIVLSCDEKSQIQALDRTQPSLPFRSGRTKTVTHDYKRNGTSTLFAALNTLNGKVLSMCAPRHRHQEWLRFLQMIDRETPAHLDDPRDRRQLRDAQARLGEARWLAGTRASTCTSRRPARRGSTWSSASSATSRPSASDAASSRASPALVQGHRKLHRRAQPRPQALHLDRQGRRHPAEALIHGCAFGCPLKYWSSASVNLPE